MMISSSKIKTYCFDGDSRTMLPDWKSFFPHGYCTIRGVSGSTTAQCVARQSGYGYLYPSAVIIEAGINDTVFDVNQAATIANIKSMINFYMTRAVKVYCLSSYPFNIAMYMSGPFGGYEWATVEYLTGANTYVDNVSTAIATYCEGLERVQFVDLRPDTNDILQLAAAYTYDGVHGSALMNQLITDKINYYESET